MVKLAIADPPYLARAARWYGNGRGHSGGRGKADFHPEAAEWDSPKAHLDLMRMLETEYDGWVIAASPDSLGVYWETVRPGVRVAVWVRENAIPSGSRIRSTWEAVLVRVPAERSAYGRGRPVDDSLNKGIISGGFAGRKPEAWTHWVLDLLGYDPGSDEVIDLFNGSGAVDSALTSYKPVLSRGRQRQAPAHTTQRVRSTARAAAGRRAAVLSALRAGGSVRAVAAAAKVSTNTVQRWKREAGLTTTKDMGE